MGSDVFVAHFELGCSMWRFATASESDSKYDRTILKYIVSFKAIANIHFRNNTLVIIEGIGQKWVDKRMVLCFGEKTRTYLYVCERSTQRKQK